MGKVRREKVNKRRRSERRRKKKKKKERPAGRGLRSK